jgi:superfamily I DNA/RNA helicase
MDEAGGGLAKWIGYLETFADAGEDVAEGDLGEDFAEGDLEASGAVQILTLHGAKGLEWRAVFIVNALQLPRAIKPETVRLEGMRRATRRRSACRTT